MKHFYLLMAALIFTMSGYTQAAEPIQNQELPRDKRQENVLQLAVNPILTVWAGFIRLSNRETEAVSKYTFIEGVKINALCDLDVEKVNNNGENVCEIIKKQ